MWAISLSPVPWEAWKVSPRMFSDTLNWLRPFSRIFFQGTMFKYKECPKKIFEFWPKSEKIFCGLLFVLCFLGGLKIFPGDVFGHAELIDTFSVNILTLWGAYGLKLVKYGDFKNFQNRKSIFLSRNFLMAGNLNLISNHFYGILSVTPPACQTCTVWF